MEERTNLELTIIEKTELEKLETVINQSAGAFYRVGCALAKIKDSRLYRDSHDTFEAYCKDRWEMGIRYADKLMLSASTMDVLQTTPMGVVPINERQARPLTKLATAEAQQEAWEMVVATAPEGKITAYHVSKVVSEIKKESTETEVKKKAVKAKSINKEEIIDDEMQRTFNDFYREIQRARLENWKNTSKEASLILVKLIKDLIEVA